ncbi:antitoxin Xre/MbcA/ParS toxin-binding domain-containing protein [Pseudomonas sp. DSP3-2-2]|uniref:antitoxin Xre/MbcA/ParS toxin-binding domain-containing protein n=1 Tax=unclassified Pseudomonas TaxID=196821 RepID=UPI003CE8D34A
MASSERSTAKTIPGSEKPTEFLLRADSAQLSPVQIYGLIAKGFELKNLYKMLSSSDLYLERNILGRVLGQSFGKTLRHGKKQTVRLSSHQSALAFQYAKVLEYATNVFGSQRLAEEWLGRPCKYLEVDAPLDIIDNALGYKIVQDYLKRIEYGVYQ